MASVSNHEADIVFLAELDSLVNVFCDRYGHSKLDVSTNCTLVGGIAERITALIGPERLHWRVRGPVAMAV